LKSPRSAIASEQIAAREGGRNPLAISTAPLLPTSRRCARRCQEWSTAGCFRSTAPTARPKSSTKPPDRVWPNANRLGAQEVIAPDEDMERVAAARATGCYRNPYQAPLSTPAAAAPTHEHTSTGTKETGAQPKAAPGMSRSCAEKSELKSKQKQYRRLPNKKS
jgi:hypothetical protein